MTARLRRALRWLQPYRSLWLRERDDHAQVRAELAGLKADFDLAVHQRDSARAFAAALVAEPEWTAEDEAFIRSLGERPA